MRSRQQLLKVSVLASAFLLAVVLGNVSLRYIPVSFAQVTRLCPVASLMCFHVRAHLHQALYNASEGIKAAWLHHLRLWF